MYYSFLVSKTTPLVILGAWQRGYPAISISSLYSTSYFEIINHPCLAWLGLSFAIVPSVIDTPSVSSPSRHRFRRRCTSAFVAVTPSLPSLLHLCLCCWLSLWPYFRSHGSLASLLPQPGPTVRHHCDLLCITLVIAIVVGCTLQWCTTESTLG